MGTKKVLNKELFPGNVILLSYRSAARKSNTAYDDCRRYAMTVAMPNGSTNIDTALRSCTTVAGQYGTACKNEKAWLVWAAYNFLSDLCEWHFCHWAYAHIWCCNGGATVTLLTVNLTNLYAQGYWNVLSDIQICKTRRHKTIRSMWVNLVRVRFCDNRNARVSMSNTNTRNSCA